MSRVPRSQPYRIGWPLNASQVESIDHMFQLLFDDLRNGNISLTSGVNGVLPAVNGGTGHDSYTIGDILYAGTSTTLSLLSDVATGNVLISGGVGAAPAYGKVGLTTHVSGILPIANGGTNSSTALSGQTIMVSDGSKIVQGTAGTTTTVLHGDAAGAPSYSAVVEADITLSNNTTNNATAARHGFLPILSNNPVQFLDGQGNFTTPAGTAASYVDQSFVGQTSVNVIHNFGAYPVVQVIDNTGAVLVPLTIVNNSLNDFTVTFAAATTGDILATLGSPQATAVKVTAANYTVLASDKHIKVTAAAVTITLLTAVGKTGFEFHIDNASVGDITVDTTSSQTINGLLTQTIGPDGSISVYSDGSNWRIF